MAESYQHQREQSRQGEEISFIFFGLIVFPLNGFISFQGRGG
jgi:hypothetical protein